jgi:hypothetical protein
MRSCSNRLLLDCKKEYSSNSSAVRLRAPIKLTMSRRSKLTTDFAGEDFQFMYDGAIQN